MIDDNDSDEVMIDDRSSIVNSWLMADTLRNTTELLNYLGACALLVPLCGNRSLVPNCQPQLSNSRKHKFQEDECKELCSRNRISSSQLLVNVEGSETHEKKSSSFPPCTLTLSICKIPHVSEDVTLSRSATTEKEKALKNFYM